MIATAPPAPTPPEIDPDRLLARLDALAAIGDTGDGGVCRLALTDADKQGRDLVVSWMRELGLAVTIDGIGNVVGVRAGAEDGPPVMCGSHIDTVRTGGRYDGNLGVLAGVEVVHALDDAGVTTRYPLAVGFFTNEEGARFQPDMMGSLVHQGVVPLADALATVGIDGVTVGDELTRIGYAGDAPVGTLRPRAFLELHVEQGPVLEREGVTVGAVTGVQGISWTEIVVSGVSNHAGTTPMSMRHDAGYAAAAIAVFARKLAGDIGGAQVATVGALELSPNLVNVVARRARLTVDLRNTDDAALTEAEARLHAFCDQLAADEGVTLERRTLARFAPVAFDPTMIDLVERCARALSLSVRRMPSGAGHDAQMFAPFCPTAMIFVPSAGGLSHNPREYTAPDDLAAGAQVLCRLLYELCEPHTP